MEEYTCKNCGEIKPKQEFYILNNKGVPYVYRVCKECVSKKNKKNKKFTYPVCLNCINNSISPNKPCKINKTPDKHNKCQEYDEFLGYSFGVDC